MEALLVALVHDVAVAPVGAGVVLVVHERVGARDEQDGLLSAHLRNLRRVDEVAALYLQVLARRGGLARALPVGHLVDGLLANHLGNLLVRGVGLAAEEQRRVAAVHDGLGLLVVLRFQLAHGLQDDGDADVARARHGDGLLNLRDGADVGELVEDEVDRRGQLAAVVREGLPAELVDGLPHEDGEQERERLVGVREDAEDGDLRAGVAQRVDVHLVVAEQVADARRGDGRETDVARDDDGFQGLARSDLEVLVVHEGEVLVRREAAALRRFHPVGVSLELGGLPRPATALLAAGAEPAREAGRCGCARAAGIDVPLSLLDL